VLVLVTTGPLPWWSWVSTERSAIVSDLLQHVELTAVAVGIGFAIAVPLALVAWRIRFLRPPFVAASGILYVIPSIALMSLVRPLTGYFSVLTAEVALVGYTLLILMRNTIAGLDSVPEEVRDAARGMGHTQLTSLVRVELPLAAPSMIAGLRVATVTVVGLVNVTAFIGQGGLGQLIVEGFGEGYDVPVVVALVLSILLAGIADALFVGFERLLLPWVRARRVV
jgi:osmoprotectant transport system permease protein